MNDHSLPSPVQVSRRQFPSFGLDDAFTDDDDADLAFQFSPDAIREEMARNRTHGPDGDDEKTGTTGFFTVHDTESVSTLDMNGEPEEPSPAASSGSLSPVDMSPQFVSISLSRSTSGVADDEHPDAEPQGDEQPSDDADSHSIHNEYPQVQIDASQPPGHRVTLSVDSTTSNGTHITDIPPPSPRSSSDHPDRPSSSQSVPLPNRASSPHNTSPRDSLSPIAVVAASSATALPPSDNALQLPPKTIGHRPTRSAGPSAFEKVMSKTRPSFLPPKSKQEDNKHLADWTYMMKQSRAAAEKKKKEQEERKLLRERRVEESLHLWERDIVPDWRVVYKNPALRKMWWRGIPTKLRSTMWERAVGNPLALSKDHYRMCLSRAKRALAAGTFPAATLTLMEQDISTTIPSLKIFDAVHGPLYPDLKDMLYAWVVSRSDEGLGYTSGAARIAGMLLINMAAPQAFIVMRNLLERHCLRSFFGGEGAKADVEAYYRIFDTLLADGMPKIYFNFKQHQISPASYLPDWLIPLFLDHLPFDACARLWDVILLEGDSFLYRAALGMLAVLEPRLFFPDKQELLELLKGENKAAIEVAKRDGLSLNDGKYEIYGVEEETLWDRIDSMDDWWRESTWTRLIQRELPDI